MKTVASALRAWAADRLWLIRPGALDAYLAHFDARPLVSFGGPAEAESDAPTGPALEILDGVAIVPAVGPLVEASGPCEEMMAALSGATTYGSIRSRIEAAASDPAVNAVLLDIDSPGGTVAGVESTAGAIREISQSKPTVAHVRNMGASGGYWLATAAPRIEAEPTAFVGSIGVVGFYEDDRRQAEAAGIDRHTIVSSHAPHKVPDLGTEAGRMTVRRHMDEIEALFLDRVAAGRGVSVPTVLDDFGQGDVLIASEALSVGMLDAVSGRPDVLARLAQQGRAARLARPFTSPASPYRPAASASRAVARPLSPRRAVARGS